MSKNQIWKKQQRRKKRIRGKITGCEARPRLVVSRSLRNIYAQVIDDEKGHTLVALNTLSLRVEGEKICKVKESERLGKAIAEKAKAAGIETVVFDRNGRQYHGRVKAVAEAARQAGLRF